LAKEALWEEAQLEFAAGKFGNCEKILDNLLTAKHRRAEAHLLKAKLALYRGDKGKAQDQVLQARVVEPNNRDVQALAKEAFRGPGDKRKLAGLFREAR
jgi:uncharacterized protein HemY